MKHCPKISPSIRNVKTLQTSTETVSSYYKLIGQCHMMSNCLHPQLLLRQFSNPTILCPTEYTLVRWIHRIHRTIWLCHNHQARRLHTSLIELNPAFHDVIFSPSDNSLSDGKHDCPMDPLDPSGNLTLPQSPSTPLAHIPNWIKPCLSWRHLFSIGWLFVRWKTCLSDGSIGSIGQSDFHELEVATITKYAACTHPLSN